MRRLQLFEFHDQPWFPDAWRRLLTESLTLFTRVSDPFGSQLGKLAEALRATGEGSLVDLCSGAGTSLIRLARRLEEKHGLPVYITLTDRYPHLEAFRAAARENGGRITFRENPVDARAVPRDLHGFRTLFISLHHFPPAEARGILADAVSAHEGIGVFEHTEPSLMWLVALVFSPLLLMLLAPFLLRPLTWRRIVWIYLVPLPLLCIAWDGLVSTMRTYSPAEMKDLVTGLDGGGYTWQMGRDRSTLGCRVTWLIGTPGGVRVDSSRCCSSGISEKSTLTPF